ncbi:uncharacterized protein LOC114251784 [Bombyx mandarina]|uniref:Uncharacterized protein n=2 Tax=Bombyx TaxID=7090 RepID=A0A8R2HP01_BOMMO|nr:uncharacterized protein LOC101739430 [Bombyx mori]XP_028041975.1 uncharacterized protein LOC114251784 [Bombyx mandarina]
MIRLILFVSRVVAVVFIAGVESNDDIQDQGVQKENWSQRSEVYSSEGRVRVNQCYSCIDCPVVLGNTTFKTCPSTNDRWKNKKCIVYSELYSDMKMPWYIRDCVSERGTCADLKSVHDAYNNIVKLDFCFECDGDRCNRVSRSLPVTFFVVFVVPVVTKHTLS